ncbi:MAG: multicopper oxidase domain-containing protein [Rhodothermales bacterium]|nr:multicopper oxidase domain-containing protein [Rhodothermales bacterium]
MCLLAGLALLLGVAPGTAQAFTPGGDAPGIAPPSRISPRKAVDLNPDPDIVEILLIAHENTVRFGPGPRTPVWTYNGGTPGPTIEANVGNTLVVHFLNLLPEETTVHWHGVDVPAHMDGSNISQEAVPPGGYFRYEFPLLRAATHWYHPHIRSNEQVEKGLYGALIIRDPAEDQALELPENEHVLILDDILLDDHGRVAEPFPSDPLENALMQLNGREGNTLLVNGRTNRRARVRRGVPQRLRLVNASNSRFMRVSIEGHRMWRIGGDGGLLEAPIEILPIEQTPEPDRSRGLLLTPGERADVVFTPLTPGPIDVEWHDVDRGRHSVFYMPNGNIGIGDADDDGARPPEVLMTFIATGPPGGDEYVPPAALRTLSAINAAGAAPIPFMFGHTPPNGDGDVTFFVQMKNGMPNPFPQITPADAPMVEVGETRIWEINNLTGGDHNFHPHGFSFQLIETQYVDMDNPANNYTVPAPYLENKDTILLPKRPGAKGRSRTITRLAVTFDDTGREGQVLASGKVPGSDTSGGWVLHCHIFEHSTRGMMSFLQVVEPGALPAARLAGEAAVEAPGEALSHSYPNPFNPSTTIRYTVPEAAFVSLAVYNLLGQEVARLAGREHTAGVHEVRWDASSHASGVYFYRLQVGQQVEVRQLVLQK